MRDENGVQKVNPTFARTPGPPTRKTLIKRKNFEKKKKKRSLEKESLKSELNKFL